MGSDLKTTRRAQTAWRRLEDLDAARKHISGVTGDRVVLPFSIGQSSFDLALNKQSALGELDAEATALESWLSDHGFERRAGDPEPDPLVLSPRLRPRGGERRAGDPE